MMDITVKLRTRGFKADCEEAADEIERLREENIHLLKTAMNSVSKALALYEAALAEKDAEIARLRK